MKRLLLLLLVVACAAPSGPTGDESVFNPLSLYTGAGSLDIELVKDNSEIYVYDSIYDTIKIENPMPYDVRDLKVSLYGIDQRYWSFSPVTEVVGIVEGRSEDNGWLNGRELVSFYVENLNLPNMYNSKVYEYGYAFDFESSNTFADADVCVGTVQYFTSESTTLSEACSVDTAISYNGQGALLNVGAIDLNIKAHTAGELQIEGTLKNSGGGEVLLIKNLRGKIGTEELSCYFLDKFRSPTNVWDPSTHKELRFECDPILFNSQPFYTNVQFEYDYIYRLVQTTNIEVTR